MTPNAICGDAARRGRGRQHTWTAKDSAGNIATATQKVTIAGTPIFTSVPGDVTVTICDGEPSIGTAKAVDVCGTALSPTSDAPAHFPIGTTTVTWTAKDSQGNIGTAKQKVTVVAAIDLNAEHIVSTVKNNSCLQVTKYPSWAPYMHAIVIQPQANGSGWPIPLAYTNCNNHGSGSLPGPWQQYVARPVTTTCPTVIKLGGNGAGSVSLTWWGNG